jgi:hypothetical protein
MTNSAAPIEVARQQLLQKEREMNVADIRFQMLQAEVISLRSVVEWLEANAAPKSEPQKEATTLTAKVNRGATRYLESFGKPASIGGIYNSLKVEGVEVTGGDEAAQRMNLSGYLNRDPDFTYIKNVGWWFSHRPIPEEGHPMDVAGIHNPIFSRKGELRSRRD